MRRVPPRGHRLNYRVQLIPDIPVIVPPACSEGAAVVDGRAIRARGYPRGRPSPRVAMMLRCTSEVPPAIVEGTDIT